MNAMWQRVSVILRVNGCVHINGKIALLRRSRRITTSNARLHLRQHGLTHSTVLSLTHEERVALALEEDGRWDRASPAWERLAS